MQLYPISFQRTKFVNGMQNKKVLDEKDIYFVVVIMKANTSMMKREKSTVKSDLAKDVKKSKRV